MCWGIINSNNLQSSRGLGKPIVFGDIEKPIVTEFCVRLDIWIQECDYEQIVFYKYENNIDFLKKSKIICSKYYHMIGPARL